MKLFMPTLAVCVAACATTSLEHEEMTAMRPMNTPVKAGDCVEARRRAAAAPDLDVDSVPVLKRQNPRPFQKMPAAVKAQVDKKGAIVKADVVVDTLGHPDMKTFRVVEASNAWLSDNVKSVMPRWTFTPAKLAGCKVARVYKFSATSRPRA